MLVSLLASASALPQPTIRGLGSRLAVTHVAGCYSLTSKPFLIEGAEAIHNMGYKTIKLWFDAAVEPQNYYPWNSQWGKVKSLVELAQTPYFRTVFDMPFETFILETFAYTSNNEEEFRGLAEHLLRTYKGSNKTFVLQNWESDWAIRNSYDPNQPPDESKVSAWVKNLNERQRGVDAARKNVSSDVRVLHAVECNLVLAAIKSPSSRNCARSLLPNVKGLDMASYSSYDSQGGAEFGAALDFLASQLDHTSKYSPHFPVQVGEFGTPQAEVSEAATRDVIDNVLSVAAAKGVPWIAFWELYCNEPRAGSRCSTTQVKDPNQLRGFWAVLPNGTMSFGGKYLQQHL